MSAVLYDTLAGMKRLIAQGMNPAHAEAVVEEMRIGFQFDLSHLATKEELRADMANLELRLQQFILKTGAALGAIMVSGFGFLAAIKFFG